MAMYWCYITSNTSPTQTAFTYSNPAFQAQTLHPKPLVEHFQRPLRSTDDLQHLLLLQQLFPWHHQGPQLFCFIHRQSLKSSSISAIPITYFAVPVAPIPPKPAVGPLVAVASPPLPPPTPPLPLPLPLPLPDPVPVPPAAAAPQRVSQYSGFTNSTASAHSSGKNSKQYE